MDYIEAYRPKTPNQMRFTAIGAAVAAFLVLRSLLRKKKQLAGKVVVITGASSGIGEALAHEFVKIGCKVILSARSIEKLRKLKEELVECYKVPPDHVTPFFLDLEDHSSIPEACRSMTKVYGKVDVLVNNAGMASTCTVLESELDTFKRVMNLNFFGQIAITKGLLPDMIEQGGGTIVAVSSLQGRFALPRGSAYGSTKHALQAFCDSLRNENVKNNIDVLVVSPSYVRTALGQAALAGDGKPLGGRAKIKQGMTSEYCAKGIIQAITDYETDYLIGPFHHRLVVYIRALCPSLYNFIMSRL